MSNRMQCFLMSAAFMLLSPAVNAADDINALANTCSACHGQQGISTNDAWPNLAGQMEVYLSDQITAFRDGARHNPLMASTVSNLNDDQIAQLASYYAALPAAKMSEANEAGKNVRARCLSCHGMTGYPVNTEWPSLAGQKRGYLKQQLLNFKSGKRVGPVMEVIAKELTDQQISDVSEYYSQQ